MAKILSKMRNYGGKPDFFKKKTEIELDQNYPKKITFDINQSLTLFLTFVSHEDKVR